MASRSVVSQLGHVPTEDAGDPADGLRPSSMPPVPVAPSQWPDHTPRMPPGVLSELVAGEGERSLAQGTASATSKGDPMVDDKRDPITEAIWVYGSAWVGAGLLGFFIAGRVGAIAGLVLISLMMVVLRRK